MDDDDPHDDIARLEARIEMLAARIESCRKFIIASKVAIAAGGVLLAAVLFGLVRFDPALLLAAAASMLGGIVLLGSNSSTWNEASEQLAATEARRAALIDALDLQSVEEVGERPTLH